MTVFETVLDFGQRNAKSIVASPKIRIVAGSAVVHELGQSADGLVDAIALDVLLAEPGGAVGLGEEVAAEDLVRVVVAVVLAIAGHVFADAQSIFAPELFVRLFWTRAG